METQEIPKELVLFHVVLQTAPLYILWDQFINVQVNLKIQPHWATINIMLVLKKLRLSPLNIVILFNFRVILGYHQIETIKI